MYLSKLCTPDSHKFVTIVVVLTSVNLQSILLGGLGESGRTVKSAKAMVLIGLAAVGSQT